MSQKDIFNISGKVALVTGASRGLGREIAGVLAEYGADVCCVGRNQRMLTETADILKQYGRRVSTITADVSVPDDVERMVAEAVHQLGRIDILINNAGIACNYSKIHEMPIEHWDAVMNTNLRSQFLCIRAVVPFMLQNKSSSIVNMSSTAGIRAKGHFIPPPYGVSKAGIISLTQYAALQYAKDNIRVNALVPGFHASNLVNASGSEMAAQVKKTIEEFCQNGVPMGRQAATSEIRGITILLASNASSYITGQIFVQDGGDLTKY